MQIDLSAFYGFLTALIPAGFALWGVRLKTKADTQAIQGDRVTRLETWLQDVEGRLDEERRQRRKVEDLLDEERATVRELRRVAARELVLLERVQAWLDAGAPPPPPLLDIGELKAAIRDK